jgi:hypothetical protein
VREHALIYGLTSGDDVPEEDEAISLLLIKSVPECSRPRATKVVRHEGGLAKASLGYDKEDTMSVVCLQPIEQTFSSKSIAGQ